MIRSTHWRRQLVDWRAAIWAGLVAGSVFLLLTLLVWPFFMGGNAWIMARLLASVLLGEPILAPPPTFHPGALAAAVLANGLIGMLYALLIAYIVHRGGLITGIFGGAALGLAIYAINFYTFTLFCPWFFPMRGLIMAIHHMIFGAFAGGIYEWLEVETFVPVEDGSVEG